jgi:Mg2+-importing ATPase
MRGTQQMTGYRRDVATSAEIRPRGRQTPEFRQSGLPPRAFWTVDPSELLRRLESSPAGLEQEDAARRLERYGTNELHQEQDRSPLAILWRQLRSPLLLLLVFAAVASGVSGEWLDAGIVMTIVAATVAIGFSQEYSAQSAAAALRLRLRVRCSVLRDGRPEQIPLEEVVPGDITILSAGSLVPADGVLLEATDFFVNQAVLTGESFPVQTQLTPSADPKAPLAERTSCVFLGSNVRSGTARCLVVATGRATEFGAIAPRLSVRPPETEFDRGIRRFGYLLTTAMLVMVLLVFAAHVFRGRPPGETLLFSVALAVGLSPELLPAILSINLARGAQRMAHRGVLVRRLNAIENLGSMNVLCTDKTGTLTEGVVRVEGAYDHAGTKSDRVLDLAACNAALETGIASPLDDAIVAAKGTDRARVTKIAEIPFDFVRKRVTVVVATDRQAQLVTKGAFHHILDTCSALPGGAALDDAARERVEAQYESWTRQGIRVLAVASRMGPIAQAYTRDDERDMTFEGFVTFLDQPKAGVAEAIRELSALGVGIKIITGDSRLVAEHVAVLVGLASAGTLTGRDLDEMNDEALWRSAEQVTLFVEVDPNQKERIIRALRRTGHVVGFLGDGVNDAPAMHAADTSLSVEQAVDVAKEAADFVLLERGLDVIRRGIEEGRATFANTLKYILITTSANLGNMVSMALASLFLPFLPLTPGQILLNNFVSDVPAIGIAGDNLDEELVDRPRRWRVGFIGRYMLTFGILSSAFDFLTFGALLRLFRAVPAVFQTAWFVESLLTELAVALVMRTRRPFFRSRPGRVLLTITVILIPVALATPYLPGAPVFGFVPLPMPIILVILAITAMYVTATEWLKLWFYRRHDWRSS